MVGSGRSIFGCFECYCVSVTLDNQLVDNRFQRLRMEMFYRGTNSVAVVIISAFRGSVLFCGLGWGLVGWEA